VDQLESGKELKARLPEGKVLNEEEPGIRKGIERSAPQASSGSEPSGIRKGIESLNLPRLTSQANQQPWNPERN